MTQLEFYLGLSGLWIAIAWMPYILERFVSAWDNGNIRKPKPRLALAGALGTTRESGAQGRCRDICGFWPDRRLRLIQDAG